MIRIPTRLKKRPQFRGLPVPYVTLIGKDGKPDFRVTDEQKRQSVMLNHWCQLCGEPLGRFCFFTGGELCHKQNAYFEPACHLDCLCYAMQVCPFILGKSEHADIEKVNQKHPGIELTADSHIVAKMSASINWVITKARGWSYGKTEQNTIMCLPYGSKKHLFVTPRDMNAQQWQEAFDFLCRHEE